MFCVIRPLWISAGTPRGCGTADIRLTLGREWQYQHLGVNSRNKSRNIDGRRIDEHLKKLTERHRYHDWELENPSESTQDLQPEAPDRRQIILF